MPAYDYSRGMTRSPQRQGLDSHWAVKLLALVLLLLCVAVGVVGLILPIIPGLLFLAFAALIAARYFPPLARRLRRHRAMAEWLDSSQGFAALSAADKLRYSAWLCLRMLLEGVRLLYRLTTQLLAFALGPRP